MDYTNPLPVLLPLPILAAPKSDGGRAMGSPLPIRLGEGLGVRCCEKIGPHVFPLSSLRGRRGPGRGGFSIFSQLLRVFGRVGRGQG